MPELNVSVELWPAITEVGLNDADAPDGTPETPKFTNSALPATTAVEMVLIAVDPCSTLKAFGLAEMEKSSLATGVIVPVIAGFIVSVAVIEEAPKLLRLTEKSRTPLSAGAKV